MANCGGKHFSVAWVTFDIKNEEIFGNIHLYDSNRRILRNKDKPKEDEVLGKLLFEIQKFLCNYCFFGTRAKQILTSQPDLALQKATYVSCPQQKNGYDCGLFALGALLHLLDGC